MVDYYNLNIVVSPIKVPTPNIIEIIDFIQSVTGIYFAIMDLVNMFSSLSPIIKS